MRTDAIVVGQDYALVEGRDDWSLTHPTRVTVLAVRQPRRVLSAGSRYHFHDADDGVRVRLHAPRGVTAERVVPPVQISHSWVVEEEYAEARRLRRERLQERDDQIDSRVDRVLEALKLTRTWPTLRSCWNQRDEGVTVEVRLDELEDLAGVGQGLTGVGP